MKKDPRSQSPSHSGLVAFEFEGDIAGDRYAALVDFLSPRARFVLLVMCDGDGRGRVGRIVDAFAAAGAKAERRSEWPGTRLVGGTATVLTAPSNAGTATFLKASSDSLFGWCAPDRPTDLCFVDARGVAMLETVAHERIGTLRLSEADWEAWNRHPRLGGDWRWRDASNNLRPG